MGYNKYGQLGLGHDTEYIIKPTLNKYFSSEHRQISFISKSVCSYSTIVKTKNGQLYGFGSNDHCQLGIGKKSFKEKVPVLLTSGAFDVYGATVDQLNVKAVSCGFHHTLFLTDSGRVICCGNNKFGQLGYGENVNELISPALIDAANLKNIEQIVCGEYFSLALNKRGAVYAFGKNDCGQLGLGDTLSSDDDSVFVPTLIRWFQSNGITVEKVQCGDKHVLCLDSDGTSYAFGSNDYGQCGCDGKTNCFVRVSIPAAIKLPNNGRSKVIVEIDVGAQHSLLLSDDNEIYSMGNNDCNQSSVGLDHKKISKAHWLRKKTEIECLEQEDVVVGIFAGFDCSFLVTNES